MNSKISKEEFRRKQDEDAARKAGTLAPEVDETGKTINPHIPQYISQVPWYMDKTGGKPSLTHHKVTGSSLDMEQFERGPEKLKSQYSRGQKAGPAATKFRKGACKNCGAMTHLVRDCFERPRKIGAVYTGKNIQADEIITEFRGGYDAKRDQWAGYDPAEHKKLIDEADLVEDIRRKMREEELDQSTLHSLERVAKVHKEKNKEEQEEEDEFGSTDEENEDDDKYADAADAVGQKMNAKTRVTVRNLRIREDTAKYLMNLDIDSAYYDPKTRSMREAPDSDIAPQDSTFAGENFTRSTGDARKVEELQVFAWQSTARGHDVHLNANPTQGELLHRQFEVKKEVLTGANKEDILSKYGGEKYLATVPRELRQGQTEDYVEYSRLGEVVKGQERAAVKSRFAEDVYPSNHTSVWGSWYNVTSGEWGYKCCHSSIHMSYCTGQAGIDAAADALNSAMAPSRSINDIRHDADDDDSKRKRAEDEETLKQPVKYARSSLNKGTQDVELEEYRRTRSAAFEDPMANYKDR